MTAAMAEAVKNYNKDFAMWTNADYPEDALRFIIIPLNPCLTRSSMILTATVPKI